MNSQKDLEPTGGQTKLSFQVGSRNLVSPSQLQEKEKEQKITETSGQNIIEQSKRFNRLGSWAKTFLELLIGQKDWYSSRCRLTWKMKATKSHRIYFQLVGSTHHIKEKESGLLLTPTTMQRVEEPEKMRERAEKNGYKNGTKFQSLASQMIYGKLLPTPRASGEESYETRAKRKGHNIAMSYLESNVEFQVKNGLLPTPASCNYKGASSTEALEKRGRLKPIADNLADQFAQPGKTSQLNPQFVMEMMGFPPDWTELPFLNGETNQSKPAGMP